MRLDKIRGGRKEACRRELGERGRRRYENRLDFASLKVAFSVIVVVLRKK